MNAPYGGPRGRLQFSIRLLLLTVAAVAVVLGLMFQAPLKVASPALLVLVIMFSALALTGATAGRPFLCAYCVGVLVPLGVALFHLAINASSLMSGFDDPPPFAYESVLGYTFAYPAYPRFAGACLLGSIALGYLCVGFRWLIERPRPPESEK
jgi:hypothetical protein